MTDTAATRRERVVVGLLAIVLLALGCLTLGAMTVPDRLDDLVVSLETAPAEASTTDAAERPRSVSEQDDHRTLAVTAVATCLLVVAVTGQRLARRYAIARADGLGISGLV